MSHSTPQPSHVVRKCFEKWIHPLAGLPELSVIGRAWERTSSKMEQQKHAGL